MNVQSNAISSPVAMRLSDIITKDRILVDREGALPSKAEALRALAGLLGGAVAAPEEEVLALLLERAVRNGNAVADAGALQLFTLQEQRQHLFLRG